MRRSENLCVGWITLRGVRIDVYVFGHTMAAPVSGAGCAYRNGGVSAADLEARTRRGRK